MYKVNVPILGGDTTGKMIVPIVKQQNGTFICYHYSGRQFIFKDLTELEVERKRIEDAGHYVYITDVESVKELEDNKKKEQIFRELMIERWARWIKLAEEKMKASDVRSLIVCPGNDDPLFIDEILDQAEMLSMAEGKVINLNSEYELISTGWTNPTPWNTYKECTEEELKEKIEKLISRVSCLETCIFNFHAPPYGSGLDSAPILDKNLRPSAAGEYSPVGSYAVRDAILKYGPLLGLHGHIHESRGFIKLGRTLCINPGSSYSEGILQGVIIDIDNKKIKNYFFITG
jgi:Icc-related predicted phosphoesterase